MQYQYVAQTKKDVTDVTETYRGLNYKLENFGERNDFIVWCVLKITTTTKKQLIILLVFNDGNSKELLNINGTIPVVYKSK